MALAWPLWALICCGLSQRWHTHNHLQSLAFKSQNTHSMGELFRLTTVVSRSWIQLLTIYPWQLMWWIFFFSSWIYSKSGGGETCQNFLPYNNQPEKVVDGREFVVLHRCWYIVMFSVLTHFKEIQRIWEFSIEGRTQLISNYENSFLKGNWSEYTMQPQKTSILYFVRLLIKIPREREVSSVSSPSNPILLNQKGEAVNVYGICR